METTPTRISPIRIIGEAEISSGRPSLFLDALGIRFLEKENTINIPNKGVIQYRLNKNEGGRSSFLVTSSRHRSILVNVSSMVHSEKNLVDAYLKAVENGWKKVFIIFDFQGTTRSCFSCLNTQQFKDRLKIVDAVLYPHAW